MVPHAFRAFTLVELIAVIVIIALLAAVLTPALQDAGGHAAASSEAATVGVVRQGISHLQLAADIDGMPSMPETLDSAAPYSEAAPNNPFFTAVTFAPVISGWSKGADATTYIGPTGAEYRFNLSTGGSFVQTTPPPTDGWSTGKGKGQEKGKGKGKGKGQGQGQGKGQGQGQGQGKGKGKGKGKGI